MLHRDEKLGEATRFSEADLPPHGEYFPFCKALSLDERRGQDDGIR